MASLVDGHHVVSIRHSVSGGSSTGAVSDEASLSTTASAGPTALLHLTIVRPHSGSVHLGMPGPRDVDLELSRGQLDSLIKQLQRLAENV